MSLNLNEKINLVYAIGNKIKFLGFNLYSTTYDQMPFKNSRQIEKFKRVKKKILAYTKITEKKLSKYLRIDLMSNIKKKLKIKNKKSTKKIIYELSNVLVNILGDGKETGNKYREILRKLVSKLSKVIINDANENIKNFSKYLINPKLLDLSKIIKNSGGDSRKYDCILISKINLPKLEFIRKFTKLLKTTKYEHYKHKDLKKIKLDKNPARYLINNSITITCYPIIVILSEEIKNKLIKTFVNIFKQKAFLINYITLINYFWKKQNVIDFKMKINKEQSQNLTAELKSIKNHSKIRLILPLKIKVNWNGVVERLKIKGFLNKKGRPSCAMRLITLGVANIIKYFRSVLYGYLCVLFICLRKKNQN